HLPARADQPLRDLLAGHLEAEEGARRLQIDRDVVRDLEGEGALSHRRAGGDDHEVCGLEARGDPVEVLEAAGEAGHLGAGLVEEADTLARLHERALEENEGALAAPLAELEDELLGPRDEL